MTTVQKKMTIEKVWDEIKRTESPGSGDASSYVLRRLSTASHFDVFAGVDGLGHVMMSIGLQEPPPYIRIESDALDYFRHRRADGSWLMVLRLRTNALVTVFGRLCQDLVDSASTLGNQEDLKSLVVERLRLWCRLFALATAGVLDSSGIKGLLAELIVLESLLVDGRHSPLEIVTAWTGPKGGDQDFQFQDFAIEVKAIAPGSESVTISSLEQLDSAGPIRLLVLTLREAAATEYEAINLNALVRQVEGRLFPCPEALSSFRDRLLEGGYVEDPRYDVVAFQCLSNEVFQVVGDFPRLIRPVVPRAVSSVVYGLSLSALRSGGSH